MYNPSSWEIEARRLKIQDYPGQPCKSLSQKQEQKNPKKQPLPPYTHTPHWRDYSVVKSFCRGLEFHSQHPHGDTQLSVTPGPGHLQISAGMRHICDLSEAWTRRMVPGYNTPWLLHDQEHTLHQWAFHLFTCLYSSHAARHTYGDQKSTCGSPFSSSILWVPGTELRLPRLAAGIFIDQAILPAQNAKFSN